MIFIITGHLGSGKSLLAVRLAFDYLIAGRRVASNLTLNPNAVMHYTSRKTVTKLPYIPNEFHLNCLGRGDIPGDWSDTGARPDITKGGKYDEDKFGLILLDEAGSWLNSRDWSDKERRGLFNWITHARKFGWDVALIVQDYEALDAQIRRSVTEVFVRCARLDRIKIPYLPLRLPRMHLAKATYARPDGLPFKTWFARGTELHDAYDTREAIRPEVLYTESGEQDMRASYTVLSPWHTKGRYIKEPATRFTIEKAFFFALTLPFLLLVKPLLLMLFAGPTRSAGPARTPAIATP